MVSLALMVNRLKYFVSLDFFAEYLPNTCYVYINLILIDSFIFAEDFSLSSPCVTTSERTTLQKRLTTIVLR
jgi:hypothetical protein